MNEDQARQKNLIDTTDCLEAVGVFRGWKNFLFVIVILCLLLLQVSFWLVNTGYVKTPDEAQCEVPGVTPEDTEQIQEAAKQVTGEEPNKPSEAAPPQQAESRFDITFEKLAWLIRFCNFVLILAAALYCLTILFSLKVSLLGRLGGINHICRAFFLSLTVFVLLLPWQRFFEDIRFLSDIVAGVIYSPQELLTRSAAVEGEGALGIAFYYLRFTGYCLVVLLLVIFSQFRSCRWSKAVLRRLEVI